MKSLLCSFAMFVLLALGSNGAQLCPSNSGLSDIAPNIYDQDQLYGGTPSPYTWYISPCSQTAPPASAQQSCAGLSGGAGAARGYFIEWDPNKGACQFITTIVVQAWEEKYGGWNAFFANPTHDRTANITIICHASATDIVPVPGTMAEAAQDSKGAYNWNVRLQSSHVCSSTPSTPTPGTPETPAPPTPVPNGTETGPAKKEGGCGGGCVFLILFFVLPVVYIAGAVAWNFKNGKRGKELAPHPEFWGSIPGLVKDGAIFFAQGVCGLVDKIRGKSGGSSGGGEGSYNSV